MYYCGEWSVPVIFTNYMFKITKNENLFSLVSSPMRHVGLLNQVKSMSIEYRCKIWIFVRTHKKDWEPVASQPWPQARDRFFNFTTICRLIVLITATGQSFVEFLIRSATRARTIRRTTTNCINSICQVPTHLLGINLTAVCAKTAALILRYRFRMFYGIFFMVIW